jgi:hypothetical protein
MARYKMVVLSRPTEGREDEYNQWYQNVHLGELVALDGIVSARRFRRARNLAEGDTYPYLAEYEIETDDIDSVVENLTRTAGEGRLTMSDAVDTDTAYAVVYEAFGPVVTEY